MEGERRKITHTCYTKPKGNNDGKTAYSMVLIIYIYIYITIEAVSSTALYTCCRDGKAKENNKARKTDQTRRHRGSRKLDSYCISRMTVTKGKDGNVSVRYIRTHTNHAPGVGELKHVPLPQVVREEVREKYGQNVKLDSILDGIC